MRILLFAIAVLATASFTAPASANPYDRGCNIHTGGLCGRDLVNWCNTWARTNHGRYAMPAECGEQRYGGIPQRRFYGGGPQPGYGQGYGYGGQMNQGSVTVIRAHPWTGHRVNGVFFCDSGPCPRNGILGD